MKLNLNPTHQTQKIKKMKVKIKDYLFKPFYFTRDKKVRERKKKKRTKC